VPNERREPRFGLERGRVFPAAHARSLLSPARRLVQSPRRTVAAIGLAPGSRVLELGSGPGFFSPQVARAAQGGHVVLLDLQVEMLRLARGRLHDQRRVGYLQADGSALPLTGERFDAVFIATVLGEVPDPAACLAEVRRVLRPGGVLAIAETRRDSDFISLPRLRELVEPIGFALVARRGIRWQFVARFRRA